jgi:hypothetical protein
MNMERDPCGDSVVSEHECWQCWNRFRARSSPAVERENVAFGVRVVIDLPCPYCGGRNEFEADVQALERIPMSEPRRQLAVLRKRLVLAGADIQTRVRELRREVSRCRKILSRFQRTGQ